MKKILSSLMAAAMILGVASAATAAPAYDGDNLKNTVTGFKGGRVSWQMDITQMGGEASVAFDLGGNAPYYNVELDVNKGGKYLSAAFDRENGEIVLTPDPAAPRTDEAEYEVEIDVVDRKTKELVAGDFFLTGFIRYDEVQEVVSGRYYNNARGVLYDFGRGAKDVKVNAGMGVSLTIPKGPSGIVDLRVTGERNASIDYMFSGHELEYRTFASRPTFPQDVEIRINSSAEHLYEYADGRLRKAPGAKYVSGEGYTVYTRKPAVYILANAPLTEGVVNEEKNTVRPAGGSASGSASTVVPEVGNGDDAGQGPIVNTGKPNPSTGAGF